MKPTWATIEPATDADLGKLASLLDGVPFRARAGGPVLGKVATSGGALVLLFADGTTQQLTAALAGRYAFNLDPERVSAGSSRTPEQIVMACPAWARPSVARALMPERVAAYERQQAAAQEAQREARKAQLREIGAKVSGRKPAPDAQRGSELSDAQEARRAQLREIGKTVSANR